MKLAELPLVTRITKSVIRVLGCNPGPVTLQGTNTYILGSGRERILVDTGDGSSEEYIGLLDSLMRAERFTINKIIMTHWHLDHTGGVDKVKRLLSADVPVFKYPEPEIDRAYNFDFLPLSEQQVLRTEGCGDIKVLLTPGHATDEIALIDTDDNALFCGDTILGHGTTFVQDLPKYMESLERIRVADPSVIYPGHGPTLTNPQEVVETYVRHRLRREEQILEILKSHDRKGLTTSVLVDIIYPNSKVAVLAAASIQAHLEKLHLENKIRFVKTDDITRASLV